MDKCVICGEKLYVEPYCEICANVLGLLDAQYDVAELMEIFKHVISSKIIRERNE